MNPTGRKRPSDDAEAENSERTEFDNRTESDLKRLSRMHGPIVASGWLFEDGDKHPLPAESGGERWP